MQSEVVVLMAVIAGKIAIGGINIAIVRFFQSSGLEWLVGAIGVGSKDPILTMEQHCSGLFYLGFFFLGDFTCANYYSL